jgi:DNA-3-methyladenine glycosylase II
MQEVAALRGCGLSQRKAEYLTDLAAHFASGRLDPRGWKALDDEALIAELVDVKGIGRWTAEMFLMFHELRPDVLPVDDLGLQRALADHYNGGERLDREAMRSLAEPWRPWRSVATWYLWRSLDPIPVEY